MGRKIFSPDFSSTQVVDMTMEWYPRVVVANGGSVTAGAGCAEKLYIDHIRERLGVKTLRAGHGGRNSYDTAILFDSFIPDDADLVIWEFAINDNVVERFEGCCASEDDMIFSIQLYIQQLRLHPNQPKLFMLYMFDSPFRSVDGRVDGGGHQWARQSVYEKISKYVRTEAEMFVGEFNFGDWIYNRRLGESLSHKLYLADSHHPNCHGHSIMGDKIVSILLKHLGQGTIQTTPANQAIRWPCGVDGEDDSILVRKKVFNTLPSTRTMSWTLEEPHQDISLLYLMSNSKVKHTGKVDKNRNDRKKSIIVPPCPHNVTFGTRGRATKNALLWHGSDDLVVDVWPPTEYIHVDARKWKKKCILNSYSTRRYHHMLVFKNPHVVDKINICSTKNNSNLEYLSLL